MANSPLRRGMYLQHEGHLYEVTEFQERHTGKQKPTVHVHLRDVRDGRPVDRNLDQLEPLQPVDHGYKWMQYLYHADPWYIFADVETRDEQELPAASVAGMANFLVEGRDYRVTFVEDRPMRVEIEDIVPLVVADTAAPVHGAGQAANILKEARLENGLAIRVPLFIKTGDTIRVDTRTRDYVGKDKGG